MSRKKLAIIIGIGCVAVLFAIEIFPYVETLFGEFVDPCCRPENLRT